MIEALVLGNRDKYVDPFLLTMDPDDLPGPLQHSGQELIYMPSGRMEFPVGEDRLMLKVEERR